MSPQRAHNGEGKALGHGQQVERLAGRELGERVPVRRDASAVAVDVPHVTVRRVMQMLQPDEAATMAELGAFFIARCHGDLRGGEAPDE